MNPSPNGVDILSDSGNMDRKKSLLKGYEDIQLKPGLYSIDVLGQRVQTDDTNSEWRRLGEALAHHLNTHQQSAVLVSTQNLEYYLHENFDRSNNENSTSFEHEDKRYVVTCLEGTRLKNTLPDILESEEFVFCLNVWLCIFDDEQTANAQVLCQNDDTDFLREMKSVISNLNILTQIQFQSLQLIVAVSDGRELLWFNPKI